MTAIGSRRKHSFGMVLVAHKRTFSPTTGGLSCSAGFHIMYSFRFSQDLRVDGNNLDARVSRIYVPSSSASPFSCRYAIIIIAIHYSSARTTFGCFTVIEPPTSFYYSSSGWPPCHLSPWLQTRVGPIAEHEALAL